MIPYWLRRLGWLGAFGALARRAVRGLARLDEPYPEEQPASWPELTFDQP